MEITEVPLRTGSAKKKCPIPHKIKGVTPIFKEMR